MHNRFGRRYYLSYEKGYAAVNYLVQGTSADIIKLAMIRINAMLKKEKVRSTLRLQMHDEFLLYVHKDEEEYLVPLIKEAMEEKMIKTYLPVDISRAINNWGEKESICSKCYKLKKECICVIQKS